jgi:hypothetical protein
MTPVANESRTPPGIQFRYPRRTLRAGADFDPRLSIMAVGRLSYFKWLSGG